MSSDEVIWGDESGWTGPDLATKQQPILTVSTLRISADFAGRLAKRCFGTLGSKELKYRTIAKAEATGIEALLKWVIQNPKRHYSYVIHKRYAITAKLVDVLVEPVLFRAGVDLYEAGAHVALAASLFRNMEEASALVGTDIFELVETMLRRPSPTTIDAFFSAILRPEVGERLLPISRLPSGLDQKDILSLLDNAQVDVLGTALWTLAFQWNKAHPKEPLSMVFDENSRLKTETSAWKVLTDPEFKAANQIARTPVIDRFSFADSSLSLGIQLADVVAGSIRSAYTGNASATVSELASRLNVIRLIPGPHNRSSGGLLDYRNAQRLLLASGEALARAARTGRQS